MPQVPYSPIPDVRPSSQGAPALEPRVPAAAFGANVAEAVESVGGNLEKAGSEIFSRAMALQELKNRADADDANTNYTIALGERHAQYSALQGRDAAQGFPAYMADIQRMREEHGQGLSPMAKRYYDSESRGQMARTIFNGAGHAATQNKMWQAKSAENVLKSNADQAFNMPDDEAGFKAKWDAVEDQVRVQASVGGWGDEQIAHEIYKNRSQLLAQRILGIAKTQPIRAKQMLADAKTDLEFNDWKTVDSQVQHSLVTTGSRVAADNINAGWDPRMKPQEIDRAAGVQEPLLRILKKAQQDNPNLRFTIAPQGGTRTEAEQADLVRRGTSQMMHSAHLDGRGIDVVPVDANGKINYNDKDAYGQIELAIKSAANDLGIPLSDEHDKISSWDPGHYSIPKDLDYSKVPERLEEPLQSRVNRAERYAREMFPDDANFGDALRQRVIANFNQEKAIERDFDFRNNTTVAGGLLGDEGSRPPTTIEDLRADPRVAAAYDNLKPQAKKKVLEALVKNSKDDYTANEANFREFMQLRGLAESNPKEFLEKDIIGLKHPRAWRRELLTIQQAKARNAAQDPRVTHAVQILKPMLTAAQLDPGQAGTSQREDYQRFVGNLQDQIRQFQEDHKKPPNADDINAIGARLLQQQHSEQFWFSGSTDRMFSLPVPDDDAKTIREDSKWKELGVTPTDEMIRRVWVAKKYQELYGTAKSATPSQSKQNVPQSK